MQSPRLSLSPPLRPVQLAPSTGASAEPRSDNAVAAGLDDPQEMAAFTVFRQRPDGAREAVSQWQLSGLYCAACAGVIESALCALPGVIQASVNASSSRAEVRWDPAITRPSAVLQAVQAAGYDAAPDLAAPARSLRIRESRQVHWRLFVAGFCMMQVMMYATPAYVADPGGIPADQLRLLQWASWLLTLPVLLFSASPLFKSAWASVRRGRIGMDVPVVLGLSVAFVASTGATFEPGGWFGHEVYFDSVTMFVFLLLGGRSLEVRARHRALATLEDTASRLPEQVERQRGDGQWEWLPARRLKLGDRVRVQMGQAFPGDGELVEGQTQADESLLTGESLPVPKRRGDPVVAGSVNLGAPVVVVVRALGADTRHDAIVALMRDAATQRPAPLRAVDAVAGPFLGGVLVLATVAAVAWAFIDPSRMVWVVVAVLTVTCPCALSLASPSVWLSATGALARRGVLLQRIDAMEVLARVDTVVFDKTGTLTHDQLRWVSTQRTPEAPPARSDTELLAAAAALAAWSTHPASRALVEAVRTASPRGEADGSPIAVAWADVTEQPGLGVQATAADGRVFRLGRAAWVNDRMGDVARDPGCPMADTAGTATTADSHTHPPIAEAPAGAVQVAFGPVGQAWLRCSLAESVRADAAEVIASLRAAGLRTVVLSGDRPARVDLLAQQLGVDLAVGGAMPEDKLAWLTAEQARGHRVAMVGDGLNDAPVLARADVSFAMAGGSPLSRLQADALVLSPRLGAVAEARTLAIRSRRLIHQNLAWAAAYNLVCIPLALVGWMPPLVAGLGMAGSSLFVVLNALRVGRPARIDR